MVLYEFLYLLSSAEILLISFIFGMVVKCGQNQFMESYKTSLRSEKFWKMCLQKRLKISGLLERDHFCQFWIVCSKVVADSSHKVHQNPKQMWISSHFFSVSVPEWQKSSCFGSSTVNFQKKRSVATIVGCCHAHHLLESAIVLTKSGIFGIFWTILTTSVHVPE